MYRVVKKLKSLKKPLRQLLYGKGNLHENVIKLRLDSNQALDMIKNVTAKEVKDAIFLMGNDKSPGPDGYTACFFKESWDIVANDVILAVQEFFTNGKLLKELNHMIIALIPKVASPSRINDYRPISCCNVLFKCISKIISNRIKESLKMLISPNQSAFVPRRRISDNILLTQELIHNYHLDRGTPRCTFKVDIQKAYDTVDWCFLKEVLLAFGFHVRMVDWIMECVTTTSYSLCINGVLHGYFKGKRGLRQGDPLSPYLFTIIMEWVCSFPTRILLELEQLMRGFLWCQGDMRKGKAKVSWEVVCLPKNEGGLGLRRLKLFNKALMVTHIWNLLFKKELLWVKWIHEYKYHLGDGATCSLWFDRWSPCGPLADIISSRDIHRAGFNLSSKSGMIVWEIGRLCGGMGFFEGVVPYFLAGLSNVADSITVIVDSIIPFAKQRSVQRVIAKLVVAACTYFVWMKSLRSATDELRQLFRWDEIHIDDDAYFIVRTIEIMDREVKRLSKVGFLIVTERFRVVFRERSQVYLGRATRPNEKKYPHLSLNPESHLKLRPKI
ncbi:hypothetical protein Tco_0459589 [Tanacetum coccineum]